MDNNAENTKPTSLDQESLLNESVVESKIPENSIIPATDGPITNNTEVTKKKRKITLKTVIIIVLILGILSLVYSFKSLFIAAVVNGTPISRLAVINKLEKTSGKNILDMLITMKLLDDEALKKGIIVTKDEIDAEVKKIEDQVKLQGLTLDQALAQQGVIPEDFRKQMAVQIELEKLLGDKIEVSDADIDKYITDYKITIPEGQESTFRDQIRTQLRQQKLSVSAGEYIDNLRASASIYYFVNY